MTQRFQQSIRSRRHRLRHIVSSDLDSQHGLDIVILGIFTRGRCEEDSCLAFVKGGKKALVLGQLARHGRMRTDQALPHIHRVVVSDFPKEVRELQHHTSVPRKSPQYR